jgi:hypothetical protein
MTSERVRVRHGDLHQIWDHDFGAAIPANIRSSR